MGKKKDLQRNLEKLWVNKIMARLAEKYNTQIKDHLKNKLGLKNIFEVPKIEKITVNIGVGEAVSDSKIINKAIEKSILL